MRRILIAAVVLAGAIFAQPPRTPSPSQYYWWESRLAKSSLNLSESQTKKLNDIQQAYVGRLMDLRRAVTSAENALNEIYNEPSIDDIKAEAAVDQYANARDNLTRVLTQMSLKMRGVLSMEQWQQLVDLQAGRAARGRGRGRGGPPPSGVQGSGASK